MKWEVDLEIFFTIPFANYEIQIMVVDCNADAKRERRSTMVKLLKRHYKDKIGRSLKNNIVSRSVSLDKHLIINELN